MKSIGQFTLFILLGAGVCAQAADDDCTKSLSARPFAQYVDNTRDNPVRQTFLWAIGEFEGQDVRLKTAVDVGVGSGKEVLALVHRGFNVVAIDKFAAPLESMKDRLDLLPSELRNRVKAVFSGIVELGTLQPAVDLFHVAFTMHYVHEQNFPETWKSIGLSIKKGGVFSGNFLGFNDTWKRSSLTWTRERLNVLFEGFTVLKMQETEFDGLAGSGEHKHWHIFSVLARKN